MHIFNQWSVVSSKALKRAATFSVPVAMAVAVLGSTRSARANLVITPTFDSTITSDPNAAAIEAGINSAITRIEADISNSVTATILFQESSSGLGGSSTYITTESYATYVNQLQTVQTRSADDNVAITSLPATLAAVNGNASSTITATLPLYRALGVNVTSGTYDSTISLNTSIMNLSRTGTQNPSDYDLQAVVAHEMDEVLGAGGAGSNISQSNSTTTVGPLDLFRFTAAGVRSYATGTSIAPYFSINGGSTNFVYFNQAGGGSDYSDWGDGVVPADGHGNSTPQVQDAFGTPGTTGVNVGANELASLDVIGWNLTAAGLAAEATVPEPTTIGILAMGALGLCGRPRRQNF